MTIEKIQNSDIEDFIEMSREFYSSPAVLENISDEAHFATAKELMRSDEYLMCYIFKDGKKPCGYGLLNKSFGHEAGGTVVWIEELYVRPEYQGHGLGTEFLKFAERNIPAARYRLETEPENVRAAGLYKRNGYSPLPYTQYVKDKAKSKLPKEPLCVE